MFRVDDVHDHLSFVTTTFRIQQDTQPSRHGTDAFPEPCLYKLFSLFLGSEYSSSNFLYLLLEHSVLCLLRFRTPTGIYIKVQPLDHGVWQSKFQTVSTNIRLLKLAMSSNREMNVDIVIQLWLRMPSSVTNSLIHVFPDLLDKIAFSWFALIASAFSFAVINYMHFERVEPAYGLFESVLTQ